MYRTRDEANNCCFSAALLLAAAWCLRLGEERARRGGSLALF